MSMTIVQMRCPACGNSRHVTDLSCRSCGAGFAAPRQRDAGSQRAALERAAYDRRWQRIEELVPQAKGLLEQGYHRLPPPPGETRGPADDLSDMCREIGESYFRNGEFERAVQWCGEALAVNETNVPARCFLVSALCHIGEYDLAQEWFRSMPGDVIDRNVVRSWVETPEELLARLDPAVGAPATLRPGPRVDPSAAAGARSG